jgi:hypothetical protein
MIEQTHMERIMDEIYDLKHKAMVMHEESMQYMRYSEPWKQCMKHESELKNKARMLANMYDL